MVPERLMQPLEMTDLLLEASPGRTGCSESDMGHCPGKPVGGKQCKVAGADVWGLPVCGTFGL